jgi:hypothetical protein
VARDPRVCGKGADKVTSVLLDAVLRRRETTKLSMHCGVEVTESSTSKQHHLITLLPTEVLQLLSGLSPEAFAQRSSTDVATYIFAKANAVEHSTIRKGLRKS